MTIDRILVAVSFSERSIDAVRKAARLAANRDATITLLHVVEPVKRRAIRRLPSQQTLLRARVNSATQELARYAGEIAARDRLPVDFRIETGNKVAAIAAACKDADVLFIGGTGMSRLAAAFSTTTVERLIGRCGIPVLVVNGPEQVPCRRALVAVSDSCRSVAAVSTAARLWPDAELTLFHALDNRPEQSMRIADVPLQVIHEQHLRRTARGLKHLKDLAARAQVSTKNIGYRLAYGDAWRAVLSVRDEMDAQVVVVTRRNTSALADFILGSTVRRLLARLPCDVLVTPEPSRDRLRGARHSSGGQAAPAT